MALSDPLGQPAPMKDGEFVSSSAANTTAFRTADVQPPTSIYIQRNDVIELNVISAQSPIVVTLSYRLLQPGGLIQIGQLNMAVPTAYTITVQDFALQEGFLLSLSVTCTAVSSRGLTFARVTVNRGGQGQVNTVQTLLADYITVGTSTGWPGGPLQSPLGGMGTVQNLITGNPAAGLEFSVTGPGGVFRQYRIIAGSATLVTSASVGNRAPRLIVIDPSANNIIVGTPDALVAAATTVTISYSTTMTPPVAAITNTVHVSIPENLYIPTGFSLASSSTLLAGDQYSNIFFLAEHLISV